MIYVDVCSYLNPVAKQGPSAVLATLERLIVSGQQPETEDGRVFCLVPESGEVLPHEDAVATISRSLEGQPFTGFAVLNVLQRLLDGGQKPSVGDDKHTFGIAGEPLEQTLVKSRGRK